MYIECDKCFGTGMYRFGIDDDTIDICPKCDGSTQMYADDDVIWDPYDEDPYYNEGMYDDDPNPYLGTYSEE